MIIIFTGNYFYRLVVVAVEKKVVNANENVHNSGVNMSADFMYFDPFGPPYSYPKIYLVLQP